MSAKPCYFIGNLVLILFIANLADGDRPRQITFNCKDKFSCPRDGEPWHHLNCCSREEEVIPGITQTIDGCCSGLPIWLYFVIAIGSIILFTLMSCCCCCCCGTCCQGNVKQHVSVYYQNQPQSRDNLAFTEKY